MLPDVSNFALDFDTNLKTKTQLGINLLKTYKEIMPILPL